MDVSLKKVFFEKILFVLIAIYIAIIPFSFLTAIEGFSFYLSILISIILIFVFKKKITFITPLSIPFLLFVVWVFIGLFFALNKSISIHDWYAHIIMYMIFFFMFVNSYNSEKSMMFIVWLIIISTTIYTISILFYFYVVLDNSILTRLGYPVVGEVPCNIIAISTLFALLLSLFMLKTQVKKIYRFGLLFCILLLTLATLLTQARGAILAIFVSLIFLMFKYKKVVVLFFLIFLIIALFLLPVKSRLDPDTLIENVIKDPRVSTTYTFVELIKEYPVAGIGYGMGTYLDVKLLEKYYLKVPDKYRCAMLISAPHNIFVDITVRTGIVGLVLFLYIIIAFIRMGWKIIKYGKNNFIKHWGYCFMVAFVALLIQGLFENTLHGPPIIILYTILGMMTILWHINSTLPILDYSSAREDAVNT